MSAFICSDYHFKALAAFAVQPGVYGGRVLVDPSYIAGAEHWAGKSRLELAQLYANALYQENVRSVLHRYADDKRGDYPDLVDVHARDLDITVAPLVVLKQCNCLAYQSCEPDDWTGTLAFRIIAAIKDAAINLLPGYEAAPWGLDAPAAQARAS